MSKVTSKLQVTIPKAVARLYGIEPGDEIEFVAAGDAIRVIPASGARVQPDPDGRLELFDQATRRQQTRQRGKVTRKPKTRGWTRAELYERGRAD